jgi:type VI secretion system protein ImpD
MTVRAVLDPAAGPQADAAWAALTSFVAERRVDAALVAWFGGAASLPDARRIRGVLVRDIARIDAMLSLQLDAILHHPRFQRLEASWRGLEGLVGVADQYAEGEGPPIKVRILTMSFADFGKDLERAIEFDQSQVFRRIYDSEFGAAGGEPFGLVLGDYEFTHRPRPGVAANDVDVLERMSHVAAASFAPFVGAAQPSLFGIDRFSDLELPLELSRTFELAEYAKWNAFRRSEDARFVALTVPRVLMRQPWEDDGLRPDGFRYREDVSATDGSGLLWGTAVYAFGAVVVRSFGETSWPCDVRGLPEDGRAGGLVSDLTSCDVSTDAPGVTPNFATDLFVTDRLEKELSDLGFLPLCALRSTADAAFYCTPSLQAAQQYGAKATVANANARLSAMLHYMLGVSRFAHFVKMIGRDKIGSYANAASAQGALHDWLMGYTLGDDAAPAEMKARYPLRDARIEVREHPSRPGAYMCVFHLRPHHQVDEVAASVKLVTELSPMRVS